MSEDKELLYVKTFPKFFRDYSGNPMETCMAFGMEFGDGWHKLFWQLNVDIEHHLATLKPEYVRDFYWSQLKEKFGTARFYYHGGDNIIETLVNIAESKTECTCEICGEEGKLRGKFWLYVSCNTHAKDVDKDREEKE